MFTFGWGEIFLLIIVLVVVIGPKELPSFIKQIASFTKSIKKISREFKSSLNEIAKDDEFTDVKKTLSDVNNLKEDFNLKDNFKTEINSIKETSSLIKNDVDEINKK